MALDDFEARAFDTKLHCAALEPMGAEPGGDIVRQMLDAHAGFLFPQEVAFKRHPPADGFGKAALPRGDNRAIIEPFA